MRLTFDHSQLETANIHSFYFKPDQPLGYTAGQYIELSLPHAHPDDRGNQRWFTLSSSPTEELISITTRISDKSSSFKKALMNLKPGHTLTANGPMGDFVLPKLIQTPLIFVAGGIGITPFRSMLSWLAEAKEDRPIQLIYAVHSEDEILFQDVFERADQHATIIVDDATSAWGGERGRLSAELILGLTNPSKDSLVYVSGPENLVESLEKDLKQAGISKKQLVLDFFPNYPSI